MTNPTSYSLPLTKYARRSALTAVVLAVVALGCSSAKPRTASTHATTSTTSARRCGDSEENCTDAQVIAAAAYIYVQAGASKTEAANLYRGWVYSNVLAIVREALEVAPGLGSVTAVVLRRESPTPYGEHPLAPIYVGTLTRDRCSRIAWDTPAALNASMIAATRRGRSSRTPSATGT